jgi:hypothetical protein
VKPGGKGAPPRESGGARAGRSGWIAAGVLVAIGSGLRLLAAQGDLWLDEIWSLELARIAATVGGVLTAVHHDNNHHLTTAWLLLLGPAAPPLALRALAVAAGAATLAVLALRVRRVGRREGLAGLALAALSPILVHYGSEARGYSLAVLLAVVAAGALDRWLDGRRTEWAVLLGASATLGFLAHLTFLYAFVALVAWGAAGWLAEPRPRRAPWALVAGLGTPALALGALWAVDLRHLAVGGGPAYRIWDVLRELLRATLGLPRGPLELVGLLAVAAAAREIFQLARERRPEWVFHVTVLAVAPALVLAWTRPDYLAPRYFVVAVPFFLLLLARSLARSWTRGGWRRGAAAAALLLFATGSAARIGWLLRDGRGRYREAVEYMVRSGPPGGAGVTSDNDFRNPVVLEYHARSVPGAQALGYVPTGTWAGSPPYWLLLHDFEEESRPPDELAGPGGERYRLDRQFRSAPLSGWNWSLYRLQPGR